jgi:predicted extracellular nuclease
MRTLLFFVLCCLAARVPVARAQPGPPPALVAIQALQGPGERSPYAGRRVATEGAVTLVTSNGFFLQEEAGAGGGRASRGLFVFTDDAPAVVVGQCVRLAGRVVEFNVGAAGNRETLARPVTELHEVADLQVLRDGCVVTPVALTWPPSDGSSLERHEGMLVTLPGSFIVQQNFFLGRFGQLTLASGGRARAPTDVARPGAAARALARANGRRRLVLDDGSAHQFPQPPPYLGDDGTVRAGDTLSGLTGVLDYGLASADAEGHGAWKIHPVRTPRILRTNPRTAAPSGVGGDLRVASANVDNFFATLADGHAGCGPRRVASDCRGARNAGEFERQRAKLVEMLSALDADVIALMEIENDDDGAALQSLVDALNVRAGGAAWARVEMPAGAGGGDAIRVAIIYRPARVALLGPPRADFDAVHNRPPLAQAFITADGAARFSVVASHFKSRRCDGASGPDRDLGDGQGCWSHRRVLQARALARFAGTVARESGVAGTLLVGDFNAYAREDPPKALAVAGFADQAARFEPGGWSYVFDGASGRLDGVFANAAMASRVTGVATWHVNADEPQLLDYAFALRAPSAASAISAVVPPWTATPWRASDHDPVVVDLSGSAAGAAVRRACVEVAVERFALASCPRCGATGMHLARLRTCALNPA